MAIRSMLIKFADAGRNARMPLPSYNKFVFQWQAKRQFQSIIIYWRGNNALAEDIGYNSSRTGADQWL